MIRNADPSFRLLHRARRALVVVPVVMAVALVATVVAGYFNVQQVLATVTRSQAEGYLRGMRGLMRPGPAPSDAELGRLLEEGRGEGLRYIAVFDSDGLGLLASAGSSSASPEELWNLLVRAEPGELDTVDGRVRMLLPRPPWERHRDTRHPAPRPLVLEFVPQAANELRAGALRTLGVGTLVALVLLLTAAVLWRLTLRAERLQEVREQERQLASLGEMAAVISHEIRNPLTSMKGHAQLLVEHLEPGGRDREKAERVVREAVRLEELTGDLLSLVRSERIRREEVDPVHLLREAAEAVDSDRIEIDAGHAPARWSLDAERIHHVLTNLLRNALQASPDGARVSVAAAEEDGRLVITVRDRGPGVPEGDEERIFEPFYTTRVRGTGLGLAVARRIAALHGGTLTAHNHPQGGAVFRLAVPA